MLRAILAKRPDGTEVKVPCDPTSTRLHVKAWAFHHESGFSTLYVGSSNLTHSAQLTGLEWNVRVSGARNRRVIDKIAAVFESYWQQPEFEPFDAERFPGQRPRDFDHVFASIQSLEAAGLESLAPPHFDVVTSTSSITRPRRRMRASWTTSRRASCSASPSRRNAPTGCRSSSGLTTASPPSCG